MKKSIIHFWKCYELAVLKYKTKWKTHESLSLLLWMMVLVRKVIHTWLTSLLCLFMWIMEKASCILALENVFLRIRTLGTVLNLKDKLCYSSPFHIRKMGPNQNTSKFCDLVTLWTKIWMMQSLLKHSVLLCRRSWVSLFLRRLCRAVVLHSK